MLGQTTQQVNEKVTCGKLNDISFLGLVKSMGYLGKIELFGLIKCVSVQGSLQGGRPYIYGSLLDYLVRTCRNVKKRAAWNPGFSVLFGSVHKHITLQGGELGGQWAGRKVFKIRWLHG